MMATPRTLIMPPSTIYTAPAAIKPPIVAGMPQVWMPNIIGAIKAKEEARKMGTERRVINWKSSVPKPAPNSATFGSSPVRSGTRTNAPNATNSICAPCMAFFIVFSLS
ncbi:Uncharacterised protein [Vibrio cholerae]|nr:Uncharacterised protein [Vibrio cholerae]